MNLQIRTGELGDTVMGSYLDPCNTDNRSNSIALRIGGECYQSGDISVSLHSNNLSVCKEFPTKMLQVPKFSKSLLEQNVNYSGLKQQRHRSLNNKTVCSEHIVERRSAHELEGGSIHVDSVETDVLCGHSKVNTDNNKMVCSEHIDERRSAHELEGGSIHIDSVETDVLCGHSKVGVFSVNVL